MYKKYYSHFLGSKPNRLHFAAHSHHPWPDVTREAHLQYWDDSAELIDEKWGYIFGSVVPEAQKNFADIIGVESPHQVAIAPNTHEFVSRIFSCLDQKSPISILTTDGEFQSFSRQAQRWEETGVQIERVPVEPFATFETRFAEKAAEKTYQLIYFSHVFFSSGYAIKDLEKIVNAVRSKETLVVVDGYHAFMALPVSISSLQKRIFYIGGSYKYAQGGEGACFLYAPSDSEPKPANTGWYASFSSLEKLNKPGEVVFDPGMRFFGATFDPSGLYRFNATMKLLKTINLPVSEIHSYVKGLQQKFLQLLETSQQKILPLNRLLCANKDWHGHFLVFTFPDAPRIQKELLSKDVITDVRGDRLRFGFGMYQDQNDLRELVSRIEKI